MQVQTLTREFRYNGVKLADPSPTFNLQQVQAFYANTYPEIVNAEIEGPEVQGNLQVYTFRRAVGTKGAGLEPADIRSLIETSSFCKRHENSLAADQINQPLARQFADMFSYTRNPGGVVIMPPSAAIQLLP